MDTVHTERYTDKVRYTNASHVHMDIYIYLDVRNVIRVHHFWICSQEQIQNRKLLPSWRPRVTPRKTRDSVDP